MNRYPIEVFWSEEDGGYIATVPDLPGCSAWGETEADAIREAHEAIAAWLEAAQAAGRAIVATRVGGVPEAVREDASALLVPSHDPAALAAAKAVIDAGLAATPEQIAEERRRYVEVFAASQPAGQSEDR